MKMAELLPRKVHLFTLKLFHEKPDLRYIHNIHYQVVDKVSV